MPIDYSLIRARPTKYRDILFRSRLEATWAAFFDRLGWRWEYEPFDMHGWVPDFLLNGKGRDILVEVKPIAFSDDVVEKKITNVAKRYDAHLMICGRQPNFKYCSARVSTSCQCGGKCGWATRTVCLMNDEYDIVFGHGPYVGFKTGLHIGRDCAIDELIGHECAKLWAQAKNATQWRPHV